VSYRLFVVARLLPESSLFVFRRGRRSQCDATVDGKKKSDEEAKKKQKWD
jgi:hypothetical protein